MKNTRILGCIKINPFIFRKFDNKIRKIRNKSLIKK